MRVEIKTGVYAVNDSTAPEVIKAINEAKEKGWELFPDKLLEKNAEEWKTTLVEGTRKCPEAWLSTAKEVAGFIPLIHIIDPEFLVPAVKQGYISSLTSREGEGRTADYEVALGLGDYVFLSLSTWLGLGASGWSIYFPPERIFEQENTVVTMMDIVHLVSFPFDERVKLYQQMAFQGEDFKELLPLFLVANYGDLNNLQEGYSVYGSYPDWFTKELGIRAFHPEIKVKDRLDFGDDCRIEIAKVYREGRKGFTEGELSEIESIFGIRPPEGRIEEWTEEEISMIEDAMDFRIPKEFKEGWGLALIEEAFGDRIVERIHPSLENYLKKGREWWG